MKVKVKDIHPNPFRGLDRYTLDEDRVSALINSIETTGFWENIIARRSNGHIEIAYGHHRLEALRRTHKPNDEVDLRVRSISNDDMLRIMADENLSEYDHNFGVEAQTVQSVLQAAVDGDVELPELPPHTRSDRAHVLSAGGQDVPYTAQSLSDFLNAGRPNGNWSKQRVHRCLQALELGDQDPIASDAPKVFADVTPAMAVEITRAAKHGAKGDTKTERKKAKELSAMVLAGKLKRSELRALQGTPELDKKIPKLDKKRINLSQLVERVAKEGQKVRDRLTTAYEQIEESRDQLTKLDLEEIATEAAEFETFAKFIRSTGRKPVRRAS